MLLHPPAQSVDLLLSLIPGGPPHIYFPSLTATQTPPAPSATSWDPAVIAAVIGAVTAIVTALLATGIAIYQTRQTRRIERENRRIEREKDEMQRRHEQEMERFRRELDVQYREKEQEKQREEAARREMLVAQNNEARAIAYRKALHLDPSISRMQILDMQQSLPEPHGRNKLLIWRRLRLSSYSLAPTFLLLTTVTRLRCNGHLSATGTEMHA